MRTPSVYNVGLSVCNHAQSFSTIVSHAEKIATAAIMVYKNHNNVGVGIKRNEAEKKTNILCFLIKQEINLWKLCVHLTDNESAKEEMVEIKDLLKKWEYIYSNLKLLNMDYKKEARFTEGEEDYYWNIIDENLHKKRISGLSHTVSLSQSQKGKGKDGAAKTKKKPIKTT